MQIPVQTFSWMDIPLVLLVLLLEVLLAADNAAALAMIVKKLPIKNRKSALFAGLFSAFFLRALGVIFAAYLIHLFWIQVVGGLYLIYISWKYIRETKQVASSFSPTSYWKAVGYIELVDVLFAVDSILGAFALVGLYYPFSTIFSKLWVVYLGGVLGVVAIRIVTGKFLKILDKYKQLEFLIFCIIGWMGVKLLVEGLDSFLFAGTFKHTLDILFWIGTLLIFLVGFLSTKWKKPV